MRIKETIFISRRPEEIWDFWLPVSTDTQWRGGITKAELTSEPPFGVGSTGIHYSKDLGPMPWTIIRWEDGRHMEWVFGECKVMEGAIGYYHVEAENNGSFVSMESTMEPPFFMRVIMFFMSGKIRKSMKGDLQRLKAIMENYNGV